MATMPGWLGLTLRDTEIDLATTPGYSFETTDTLLGEFDRHVREAREALASARDADFSVLCPSRKVHRCSSRASWGGSAVTPKPPHSSSRSAQRLSPPERRAAALHLWPDRRRAMVEPLPHVALHPASAARLCTLKGHSPLHTVCEALLWRTRFHCRMSRRVGLPSSALGCRCPTSVRACCPC